MTILYFVIAIGILILVHELGHFLVAKKSGIRVEKFSIGFGPKIVGFTMGETEYKIAPIPLGGYVKMTGEDPEDESAATDERSFANKSVWTRIKVVIAGPIMNLIFAFIAMPIVFMIGRVEPSYLSEAPVLVGVKGDSPAAAAGFQVGDKLLSIDGKTVSTWDEAQKAIIISTGRKVHITLDRSGKNIDSEVKVETMPELRAGYIGVEPMFFFGNEARIDQVKADGPAGKAGIKAGDKVKAIDGKPVDGWIEMSKMIHDANGKEISLTIDRNGESRNMSVTPEYNKEADKWVIGVVKGLKPSDVPMINKKYGFVNAVKHGTRECVNLIVLTFEVLKKLFTAQLSYKSLGGPIQIAQASAAAASYGLSEFLYFMAFLSIQLGVLNLLPIPVLDGGHVLFCVIEAVIRRPVPNRIRSVAQYAGLILILGLMFFVTMNDIDSVWGIKKIIGKIF